eukprot:scaffold46709_cov28-Prasinocladus_malaysianus.AAC.1
MEMKAKERAENTNKKGHKDLQQDLLGGAPLQRPKDAEALEAPVQARAAKPRQQGQQPGVRAPHDLPAIGLTCWSTDNINPAGRLSIDLAELILQQPNIKVFSTRLNNKQQCTELITEMTA